MTGKVGLRTRRTPAPIEDPLYRPKLPNETDEAARARFLYDPAVRAIGVGRKFTSPILGDAKLTESLAALEQQISSVSNGDLSGVERKLVAQADTLDAIFNDMARRAALNAGRYLHALDVYMRLALKAQSQCRATLEALANIKNPPLVFAQQANITAGPQQVNNRTMQLARVREEKKDEIRNQSLAPCRVDEQGGTLQCDEQAFKVPMSRSCSEG